MALKYRDIELYHIVRFTDRGSFLIQANMQERHGLFIGKTFEIGDGAAKWHGAPNYLIYEVLRQLYKMHRDKKLRFVGMERLSSSTIMTDSPPCHEKVFQHWYETGQVFAGEWEEEPSIRVGDQVDVVVCDHDGRSYTKPGIVSGVRSDGRYEVHVEGYPVYADMGKPSEFLAPYIKV